MSTSPYDVKITKKLYPRTNTTRVLEFVLDKDPNLFLRKDRLLVRGATRVHEDMVIENGFAAKLFSQLSVSVDSSLISVNKTR